jgi:translation initiation factor IF-3
VRVVIEENGQKTSDVMSLNEALRIAHSRGEDLVEINPNSDPPICKIIEYSKLLYEMKKKEKDNAKKSHNQVLKELRLTPQTDDHDFAFKLRHSEEWLKKGNRVRATVFFKGREIIYKSQGELLLLRLADALKDISKAESLPVLLGKKMSITLAPK